MPPRWGCWPTRKPCSTCSRTPRRLPASGWRTRPARTGRVDTRPPVVLYVHLSQAALQAQVGVARVEGIGPVTLDRVRTWLGHAHVTVKPVLDVAGQTPVDAYETPDALRDALYVRNPVDAWPYATNAARTRDADHTIPYLPPDEGGPPGQTGLHNLTLMTRFHHRIKTHGRWQVRQVFPGVLAYRSPHGRHYLVDHTGTTPAQRTA